MIFYKRYTFFISLNAYFSISNFKSLMQKIITNSATVN